MASPNGKKYFLTIFLPFLAIGDSFSKMGSALTGRNDKKMNEKKCKKNGFP